MCSAETPLTMDGWYSLEQDRLSLELVTAARGAHSYPESTQSRKGRLDLSSYPWRSLPTRQRVS